MKRVLGLTQMHIEEFPLSEQPSNAEEIQSNDHREKIYGSKAKQKPPTTHVTKYSNFRKTTLKKTTSPRRPGQKEKPKQPEELEVTEVYRVRLPCTSDCSNCVGDGRAGPVQVHVSEYTMPRVPLLREICDGHGRHVIPRTRRRELRGLVYNRESHSLYPPVPRGVQNADLQIGKNKRIFY